MSEYLMYFVIAVGLLGFGNLMGDQATLKDCATNGLAHMAGGGTVSCEVVKEQHKE